MPTVTADKIIGKGLIAKKKIDRLNSSLQKIGEYMPGDAVGVVYSYIQRGGQLYWLFQPDFMPPYLVKHETNAFVITDEIRNVIDKQKSQLEKEKRDQEIADKGLIPYYIERYGKWVLIAIVGTAIVKTLIQNRK